MKQIERIEHFPSSYGHYFADVFRYYNEQGEDAFEWTYGNDRYRVAFAVYQDGAEIDLFNIQYDGDWDPRYYQLYHLSETNDTSEHFVHELAKGQVPRDGFLAPELVLRSLLHVVQSSVQLRCRNKVK